MVVVNLLLCLIYKLNFNIGMYVEKNTVYVEFGTLCGFRHLLGGSLGVYPTNKGRLLY